MTIAEQVLNDTVQAELLAINVQQDWQDKTLLLTFEDYSQLLISEHGNFIF